jgi:WD40 repeat protein
LQRLRGVRMIVDDHLGKALGSLGGAERKTAIDMFDHLVTPSGGKIAESVSDLAKRTGHAEDQVDEVLRKLDDERILRPVPAAPGQDPVRSRRYEIFHDVLASPINRAIAAREEQRRVRRFRRLAALAAALLVVVSAVAVVFAYLLNSANTEKLTAESRELAADADLNAAHDPELSTSLALQALKLSPTGQAADALRATLPELQLVKTFHDGTGVSSAAFDPADSSIVASADNSGVVWISNIRTGRRLEHLLPDSDDLSGGATAVAFNPAGTKVAVGSQTGTVDVFDARSGRIQKTEQINGPVSGLDFAGSTGELAIAGTVGTLLWDYATTQCCDTDLNVPGYANSIAANPHDPDEFVVTTSDGVFIATVDHSGKLQSTLHLMSQPSYDAKFSPDGSEVVTPDADGSVSIYRVATRKIVTTFSTSGVTAVDAGFSPDGKQIVAGYQDGTGRVWDIATGLQLTLLSGHTGSIASVQFSPDGREVATASADGTIRVWYAEPRELRAEFTVPVSGGASSGLYQAEYMSGRIITTDLGGNIFVYSPAGKLQAAIKTGHADQQVSWDRAGTRIVAFTGNSATEMWQATGSGYTRISTKALRNVDSSYADWVVLSPDGSRLVFATDDPNSGSFIQVEDVNTGKALRSLNLGQSIGFAALSPDGQDIAGADASGQVDFWNRAAVQPQVLGSPGPGSAAIGFNESGSEFLDASDGGVVTVWSALDGRVVTSINACPSPQDADFSPDGSKIVVACTDGTVRVFDVGTGRALTVIQATSAGSVADAGFSPDGQSIVVGVNAGDTGEVQIWNAELATSSLPGLERIAEQRVGDKLTAAQLQQYLSGGDAG